MRHDSNHCDCSHYAVCQLYNGGRTTDYALGFLQVKLNDKGEGSGEIMAAAKIRFDKKKGHYEIESYGNQYIKAVNVRPNTYTKFELFFGAKPRNVVANCLVRLRYENVYQSNESASKSKNLGLPFVKCLSGLGGSSLSAGG